MMFGENQEVKIHRGHNIYLKINIIRVNDTFYSIKIKFSYHVLSIAMLVVKSKSFHWDRLSPSWILGCCFVTGTMERHRWLNDSRLGSLARVSLARYHWSDSNCVGLRAGYWWG